MRRYAPKPIQRFVPDLVPASILARITIAAVGVYGMVQGVAILRSDPQRFAGPGYATIRDFPAAMDSWGIAFLILGVGTLVGSWTRNWWVKSASVGLMSVSLSLFGSGAWFAVLASPAAGPTGPPIYYLGAVLCAVLVFHDESRRP